MRRSLLLLLMLLFVLAPAGVQAHDRWLEAEIDAPAGVGAAVPIRMFAADDFHKGEEKNYSDRKAADFVHVTAAGTIDLKPKATDGASPGVSVVVGSEGGHLVAMRRTVSRVSLPGWRFTSYLKHEKFDAVLAARKAADLTWEEGRERYSRFLKTLVQVGATSDETYGAVLGHTLEIVPLNDPARVAAGDPLVVRLLFEGAPSAGTRVVLRSKDKALLEATTDANGVARFVVPEAGHWLIRAVVIRACASCPKADWESFWAAYTFRN